VKQAHDDVMAGLNTLLQHAKEAAARDAAIEELAGQIPALKQQVADLTSKIDEAGASANFDTSDLVARVGDIERVVQSIAPDTAGKAGTGDGGGATGTVSGGEAPSGGGGTAGGTSAATEAGASGGTEASTGSDSTATSGA
jgi:hypothetical protein